nr:hypothetical protein [uncultured Draconibacterium sp.]
MKKLLLVLLFALIGSTTLQAQVELKGIKINEVNQFEGTKSLAGIDFDLKTFNLSDGICAGLSGRPAEPVTGEQLNNLIAALNKYYDVDMRFWATSDDLTQGFYRAAKGKKKDKCLIKVECFQSPEVKPDYTIVLWVVNKELHEEYLENKEVKL